MTTLYFNLNDNQLIKEVVKAAFPELPRGTKIQVTWGMSRMNLTGWWDEGNCNRYSLVNLSTLEAKLIPTAHPFFEAENHAKYKDVELKEGFVAVQYRMGWSGNHVTVFTSATAPVLSSGEEISEDLTMLLLCTKSLKSSYAGISDYRAYSLKEKFGWTAAKVQNLRNEAISKGLMSKNKALTINGKNAIANHPKRFTICW